MIHEPRPLSVERGETGNFRSVRTTGCAAVGWTTGCTTACFWPPEKHPAKIEQSDKAPEEGDKRRGNEADFSWGPPK